MSWVEEFFDGDTYEKDYAGILADAEGTAREADFIADRLELKETDRVLDLACGHGRHAVLIAGRVASVVGLDRTERFLESARDAAAERDVPNCEFVLGDMRELDYTAEFEAAYNYFTAWGYYSDEENFDVLVRVCRALKPGGRFLLELTSRDALMRRFKPRDWREMIDGTVITEDRRFDYASGRLLNKRTYRFPSGEVKEVEVALALPAADELARIFRRAGFAEARAVAAPTGEELTIDSFRVAVIGRKT